MGFLLQNHARVSLDGERGIAMGVGRGDVRLRSRHFTTLEKVSSVVKGEDGGKERGGEKLTWKGDVVDDPLRRQVEKVLGAIRISILNFDLLKIEGTRRSADSGKKQKRRR